MSAASRPCPLGVPTSTSEPSDRGSPCGGVEGRGIGVTWALAVDLPPFRMTTIVLAPVITERVTAFPEEVSHDHK